MYLPNPSATDRIWWKVKSKRNKNFFLIQSFFILDCLSNQD